jgi:large conductance mechanosensitive channel
MGILNEFKAFLLRGNVVDLAVAVVLGVAFGAVVTSLVEDLLTPLLGAIFGEPDFSGLTFEVNKSRFFYGDFINAVISFLMIAAAVFFFVIVPYNELMKRMRKEPPPDETIRKCPECTSAIPTDARRCMYCTSEVGPVAA